MRIMPVMTSQKSQTNTSFGTVTAKTAEGFNIDYLIKKLEGVYDASNQRHEAEVLLGQLRSTYRLPDKTARGYIANVVESFFPPDTRATFEQLFYPSPKKPRFALSKKG